MSHCQNPLDEAGFQVCNGNVCTCQCDACTPLCREYAQGFDDACAIYTQAALDMARTLAGRRRHAWPADHARRVPRVSLACPAT